MGHSKLSKWAKLEYQKQAARQLKKQLVNAVADELEARPEDLEIEDEEILVKGSPERLQSFLHAVAAVKASSEGKPLVGLGYFVSPSERANSKTWEGNVSGAYSFHAMVSQVELDGETGQAQVRRVVAAQGATLCAVRRGFGGVPEISSRAVGPFPQKLADHSQGA